MRLRLARGRPQTVLPRSMRVAGSSVGNLDLNWETIPHAGWGWYAAAPDNSLITAREVG